MNTQKLARRKWKIKALKRHPYCYYCGQLLRKCDATVDHFFPLSKGGRNLAYNFRLSCKKCNMKKSDKVIKKRGD